MSAERAHVLLDESAVPVDPPVGAFDDPAAWLDDEGAGGLGRVATARAGTVTRTRSSANALTFRFVSVAAGSVAVVVRHTTFQWVADPTVEQARALARYEGAARFAFNQGLRLHLNARNIAKSAAAGVDAARVPWTGFDLINAFNAWKRSKDAGRRLVVDGSGVAEVEVTGLVWRGARRSARRSSRRPWSTSAQRSRHGPTHGAASVPAGLWGTRGSRRRTRSAARSGCATRSPTTTTGERATIRLGEVGPRSVTLPSIGAIKVHDDTRRLRRMLAQGRARILFATVSRRGGRWRISLNVEAADLHPAACHPPRDDADHSGWIGLDRGLHAPVVVALADGTQTLRIAQTPKALRAAQPVTRRLQKAVSRKVKGSANRRACVQRLARHHERVAAPRHQFLHQVSNLLVETHDRLVLEDLTITGMLANHRLAAAISDAAWGELARQLRYKQTWRRGEVLTADRWFPSSKTCSNCKDVKHTLTLADRVFTCDTCGHTLDRDLNAAVNLATWGEQHHAQVLDPEARGRVTNAHRPDGSGPRPGVGETSRDDVGTLTAAAVEGRPRGTLPTPSPRLFDRL